jgi:hypothetical protein
MDLKMEEINNSNNQIYLNKANLTNHQNYWEQSKIQKEKKKKITFDDILSNMNLVVNNEGVLQYMRPIQTHNIDQNYNDSQNYLPNQQNEQSKQLNPINNPNPIDHSVKHSYIYNKYFKDYKDNNVLQVGPRRPKTIGELKQMLRDDKIKEIQQKIRISQVKSKKMLFTNLNGVNTLNNNLRSMSFK